MNACVLNSNNKKALKYKSDKFLVLCLDIYIFITIFRRSLAKEPNKGFR